MMEVRDDPARTTGELEVRLCAIEGCQQGAKGGSLHCPVHAQRAVGKAARRELKDLVREIEKLRGITDPKQQRRAELRFSRRWNRGGMRCCFPRS